jgi:anti-anti-sigma regulatory factor
VRLVAAGMSPRVREVFRITKVDTVVPIASSVDEAEIN